MARADLLEVDCVERQIDKPQVAASQAGIATPAVSGDQTPALRQALLTWFDQHKRDLPWRRTRDPYAIWVSEIMLQQTRVAAVLDHYARWMARFPTVAALAASEEAEVLSVWSGLGYYRRARFLHAAARALVAKHGGELPNTAAALRALPGIGEYTAAAVASIAHGEPVAVVDGNVERVVLRLGGWAETLAGVRREIHGTADRLLMRERPGDWNQAMMELGATTCLPRAPLCLHCPVQPWCATRGEHPTAPKKTMQSRAISYGFAQREGQGGSEILLTRRPADASLMPGMWELPEVGDDAGSGKPLLTVKHSITVTNYTVGVVSISAEQLVTLGDLATNQWFPISEAPRIALTGLARKVLKRLQLWPQIGALARSS